MKTAIRILPVSLVIFLFLGCSLEEKAIKGGENNLSLGASARELLSDEKFTSIQLEIVYVSGLEPSAAAIKELQMFLQERTHKPNGISVSKREIPSPGIISYQNSELQEIEKQERKKFNAGDEISVFILFTDGRSADQEHLKPLLGTAYRNTSIIIYEEVIRNFGQEKQIPVHSLESTTLKHEFGHLFGLVGKGSPVQTLHEDSKNKFHCNVSHCLMAAEVEFTSTEMAAAMKSQETIDFDPHCVADLRANGGK